MADRDAIDFGENRPTGGVAVRLSGGGYRAKLFHVGELRRLSEAGRLPRLTRVASVAGGSFTTAKLGMRWSELVFDGASVATNFADLVEGPVLGSETC